MPKMDFTCLTHGHGVPGILLIVVTRDVLIRGLDFPVALVLGAWGNQLVSKHDYKYNYTHIS